MSVIVQALSAPMPRSSLLAPPIEVPRRVEPPIAWESILEGLWAIGACLTILPLRTAVIISNLVLIVARIPVWRAGSAMGRLQLHSFNSSN